jgi:hypothetical protein
MWGSRAMAALVQSIVAAVGAKHAASVSGGGVGWGGRSRMLLLVLFGWFGTEHSG